MKIQCLEPTTIFENKAPVSTSNTQTANFAAKMLKLLGKILTNLTDITHKREGHLVVSIRPIDISTSTYK